MSHQLTSSQLDPDTLLGFVVSGLIALGGLIGFVRKGSVASLIAGGTSGAVMAYGVTKQQANPKDVWLVVGTSSFLALTMGRRWLAKGAFMPAGITTLLSLLVLVRFGTRLL